MDIQRMLESVMRRNGFTPADMDKLAAVETVECRALLTGNAQNETILIVGGKEVLRLTPEESITALAHPPLKRVLCETIGVLMLNGLNDDLAVKSGVTPHGK